MLLALPPKPVKYVGKDGHNQRWLFLCQCGKKFSALWANVASGNTKSCGCHRVAVAREKATIHGMSKMKIYHLWHNIIRRCYDEKCPAFKNYGGRGIVVCDRWREFKNFYADMGKTPLKLTLERRDNNGPYSPENCLWATRKVQCRNKRNNRLVEIEGVTKTASEWAELSGFPVDRLYARLRLGWTGIRLLSKETWKRETAKEAIA